MLRQLTTFNELNSRCFMEVLHSASSFAENLKKLLEEPGKVLHPYAITTNGQFLYWTDWSKKAYTNGELLGKL